MWAFVVFRVLWRMEQCLIPAMLEMLLLDPSHRDTIRSLQGNFLYFKGVSSVHFKKGHVRFMTVLLDSYLINNVENNVFYLFNLYISLLSKPQIKMISFKNINKDKQDSILCQLGFNLMVWPDFLQYPAYHRPI